MEQIEHIYVHIPFCSGKCVYCSFYSESYDGETADRFLAALKQEIEVAVSQYVIRPKTVYIGGGTPSLLAPAQLRGLLEIFDDSCSLADVAEYSIEANPGTLPPEKMAILAEHGVNRISIGAQSMDDGVLSRMARRHSASETRRTVEALRAADFDNIGLDLIACLPGVDGPMWTRTVEEAIALAPQHISVYALSVECGSLLYEMQQKRQWQPIGTEEERTAIAVAESQLTDAGYDRYEISNYAQTGYNCQHNTAVWEGKDYIGFGPAASSRIGLERRTNRPDLEQYTLFPARHPTPPRTEETISPRTDAIERFIFTFRLRTGVDPEAFANRYGAAAKRTLPAWLDQLAALENEGLVARHGNTWALTHKGINFADTVAERLLP